MRTTDAARLFAALGHEARLIIFRRLVEQGELSAGALAVALAMPPSSLSFHLKDLRLAGLVEARREGRQMLYAANPMATEALAAFLGEGMAAAPRGVPERPFNVLFLCSGNSARSIMAEAILNAEGQGWFRAYSAGSRPTTEVHPMALKLIARHGLPTEGLAPKHWRVFAGADAPQMDFVFTVCDDVAGETCPTWPGQPLTAHWGVPDPVAAPGSEADRALVCAEVFTMLANRISIFRQLPFRALNRVALQDRLDAIGGLPRTAAPPALHSLTYRG